jgi:acetyltransferase-like isoleucine patch superfamily enzyme
MKTLALQTNQLPYLLCPYQCKVFNECESVGLLGVNSFHCLRVIDFFVNLENRQQTLFEIGNFCEVAGNSRILAGGEHHNQNMFNNSIVYLPELMDALSHRELEKVYPFAKGRIVLGHNVVVSSGVSIVSGVKIGHGAVIGAGSVVTKDVPDFAIVAGNPATVLKYRFDEKTREALLDIRWWEFELTYLQQHLSCLLNEPTPAILERLSETHQHRYQSTGNYIVLKKQGDYKVLDGNSRNGYEVIGIEQNKQFTPLEHAPFKIKDYLNQASQTNNINVRMDLFD